jgi:hypothetical protein
MMMMEEKDVQSLSTLLMIPFSYVSCAPLAITGNSMQD